MPEVLIFQRGDQLHIRTEESEETKLHQATRTRITQETYEAILFSVPEEVQHILQQIIQ